MSNLSRLKLFHLLHLSKPASDRLVYRDLQQQRSSKIIELGIGTGQRTLRMIELAAASQAARDIVYTGIDLFEDRGESDGPGLKLLEAHRLLKATGVRVRLVPGTPAEGLARVANSLEKADLLVVSSRWRPDQLVGAWFFIPRLLHEGTRVFLETGSGESTSIRLVAADEIQQLAAARRRAA